MLNVVLYQPEIPSNTGNIGRTCVVTGTRLHLIHPLGFKLDDQALKRAGMNYWHNLDVREHAGWEDFLANEGLAQTPERLHLLTKRASRVYTQATYHDGDYLVFGKESTGIAQDILAGLPQCCERIPMLPDAVSLDDAPAWRERHDRLVRQDICGNFVVEPSGAADGMVASRAGISSLNLSNSVAIVLYEALRQVGYPGM